MQKQGLSFVLGRLAAILALAAVGVLGLPTIALSTSPAPGFAGRRCGTPEREVRAWRYRAFESDIVEGGADCSQSATHPDPVWAPGERYEIPVVVHVIMDDAGVEGAIDDALIHSQIDILNEDFEAIFGSNGAAGEDVAIRFVLADVDPKGAPTTGITRSQSSTWFADDGDYWNSLAWDPTRYLNIYTNLAGGDLGYVPFLPADAGGTLAGTLADRVVIFWQAFGRDAPTGPPYDQGRTATHEIGHYLGLEHTFNGGCAAAAAPDCYTSGDLICDTEPEQIPTLGCPVVAATCGSPDPIDNYMDYSDDLCMERFTSEQVRRLRCSLISYRPQLYRLAGFLFADGFESGGTSAWSGAVP